MNTNDDIILYNTEDVTKVEKKVEQEIETFDLVHPTHEALSKVLPEFDFDNAPINPSDFASSLVETCKKYNGYGLSANQCGFEHRVFVMGTGDHYIAYFNPKLLGIDEETIHMAEACLSFPMLSLSITRPKSVEIEYQDYNGVKHTTNFTGLTARCFLHELDHMNGITYTERAKPLALKQGLKKMEKERNKFSKELARYVNSSKPKNVTLEETQSLNAAQELMKKLTTPTVKN